MKNIRIRRNDTGVSAVLRGVVKIQAPDIDSFTTAWVEEDVVDKTAEIKITKNGTYLAAKDNLYGFTKATINVQFDLPYSGVTQSGVPYTIYLDSNNRPHLLVEAEYEEAGQANE